MESVDLDRLEAQIDHLLRVLEDLRTENQYLRNQAARYAREKSLQYQNNRQTVGKIKKIISHLQEALI
jgi:cell division protein ZapB